MPIASFASWDSPPCPVSSAVRESLAVDVLVCCESAGVVDRGEADGVSTEPVDVAVSADVFVADELDFRMMLK